MSSQLVPELVVMQQAAPVPEQTHSVDELPAFFPSNAFMAFARSFNTLYGIAKS